MFNIFISRYFYKLLILCLFLCGIDLFAAVNQPPVAKIKATPESGVAPLNINLNGGNSTDDLGIVKYVWRFDDNTPLSQGVTATHTFQLAGNHLVSLTVTDTNGVKNTKSIIIRVTASSSSVSSSSSSSINSSIARSSQISSQSVSASSSFSSANSSLSSASSSSITPVNTKPSITSLSLPHATNKSFYSSRLTAIGGDGALSWSLVSGNLPAGMSLQNNGTISGTPTLRGTSNFTVRVADSDLIIGSSDEDTVTLSLVVDQIPIAADIPDSNAAITVVVLGASTAACKNLVEGGYTLADCWVNRFSSYLSSIRPGSTVINLAVAGTGTCGGLPSTFAIPSACANAGSKANGHAIPDTQHNITQALSFNPKLILVNYPHDDKIGVDPTIVNFQIMQDEASAAGVPIWIGTTQPSYFDPTVILSRLDQRDKVNLNFAPRKLDFWSPLADPVTNMMLDTMVNHYDDMHPNAEGHRVIFESVKQGLSLD